MYRSLAGVWIIFALAWLALVLSIGAKLMESAIVLTRPGLRRPPGGVEDGSSGKLEEELGQRA